MSGLGFGLACAAVVLAYLFVVGLCLASRDRLHERRDRYAR
jgi:hypothetical protein